MTVSGLLLFMFISVLLWLLGELMKGADKKSTPTTFKPTPPRWWERDIESFIRKYWVWIVVFIVWLAVTYVVLIYAIALGVQSLHSIPKQLPPIR